jgi:competence protein ComEA
MRFIQKYQTQIGIVLIILIAVGGGIILFSHNKSEPIKIKEAEDTESASEIKVDVEGAVEAPGVYTFRQGERVEDAIRAARPKEDADLSRVEISLAAKLIDGQRIIVPSRGEVAGSTTSSSEGKININTASLSELDTLPGIGEKTAQKIIDYRQSQGGFKTIEDIKNVKGIGEKKFEDLKDYITVY